MSRHLCLLALLLAAALAPRALHAQGRAGTVELGVDGGFEFSNVNELDEYRFQHKSDLAPASNNYHFAAGFSWYTKSP